MFSLTTYKIVHLFGIFLVFLAYGGVIMRAINGGDADHNWRKQVMMSHGIGLFLILLGGFGMMAKYGSVYSYTDGWVIAKIVIWLIFGGLISAVIKNADKAKMLWWIVALLGVFASYLALVKPF